MVATRRRVPRWVLVLAAFLVIAAVGFTIGVVIVTRMQTGEWRVPETGDFVRVLKGQPRGPSRTIFLERHAIDLRPGIDDAAFGVSSVLASGRNAPARLPGWKGSDAGWARVVACVRDMFAPFAVEVTDRRPVHADFILVAVGGRPGDIGVKSRRIGGLAPFNGEAIARAVVYAFAAAQKHDPRTVCETIAMEVAHAYGLDHGYDCHDVMTYLPRCGPRRFVDRYVRCGEHKPRACEGGGPTQNSFRHLSAVLGARP